MKLPGRKQSSLMDVFVARRELWLSIALFLAVISLFWPATGFEFTTFDDPRYVTENPMVQKGITWEGIKRAFRVFNDEYWLPPLWLSYMLDSQIFGRSAVGFHLTNILIHGINAVLVFVLLLRSAGRMSVALVSSALFALHPLRVESVAWIVERKGLLSSFFLLLGLHAYVQFVKDRRLRWYGVLTATYILSLMTKPLLVTLPLLLLVLDFWPLDRYPSRHDIGLWKSPPIKLKSLLLEKVPLLFIGGFFAILTMVTQSQGRRPWGGHFTLGDNIGRGALSYFHYLGDLLWPVHLGVRFYDLRPHPISLWEAMAAVGLLAGITAVILLATHRGWPGLAAGWMWYLVALLPVNGVIPVGLQQTADRWTYVPDILLVAGIVWAIERRLKGPVLLKMASLALIPVLLMGILTRHQLRFWQGSVALATRSMALAPDNVFARLLYADAVRTEDLDRSERIYTEILREFPEVPMAHESLSGVLWLLGRKEEALNHLRASLQLKPDSPQTVLVLANGLFELGRMDESAFQYRAFLELEGTQRLAAADAHNQLGLILRWRGDDGAAADQFSLASGLDRKNADYHFNLAVSLAALGDRDGAVRHYRESLRINPGDHRARLNLAEKLFEWGEAEQASVQYREIARRLPGRAEEHLARGRLAEIRGDLSAASSEYRVGLGARALYPEVRARLELILEKAMTSVSR